MSEAQSFPSILPPAAGGTTQRNPKSGTVCGLAIANAIHSEYLKLRYEKLPHEDVVEELQNTLCLLPDQIEQYVALYETYISPQCEHAVALDISYLESIDLEILFAFQPFLLKRYQDPNKGSSQFIRVAQHSLGVCLWDDDWKDLADLPSYQFRHWVQILNGEPVDPPCDDIPY